VVSHCTRPRESYSRRRGEEDLVSGQAPFFAKIIPYRGAGSSSNSTQQHPLRRIDRKKKFEAPPSCGLRHRVGLGHPQDLLPYEESGQRETMLGCCTASRSEDVVDQTGARSCSSMQEGHARGHQRMLDKGVQNVKLLTGDPEKDDRPSSRPAQGQDQEREGSAADIYKKAARQEFIVPRAGRGYLDNCCSEPTQIRPVERRRHKIAAKLHHFLWKLSVRRDLVCRPTTAAQEFRLAVLFAAHLCIEDIIATSST